MKTSKNGNLSKTYQGKYVADEETLKSIKAHLDAKVGNPHKVTASDVGSYTKGEVDSIVSGKANIDDVYTKDIIDHEFQKVEIAWDTLSKNKAGKDTVYTKEEVDGKIEVISSEIGNRYTKEEVDKKLSEIGGSVDAYTKAEIDEKLKNPSYEEQVKLKGITTATPFYEGALIEIKDNSVSSDACTYDIDIHGDVKFTCVCTTSLVQILIDGKRVAAIGVDGENGVTEYTFEGVITNGMTVHCSMATATFTEFVKKIYVSEAIGNIDAALDELHNYATSLIGGEA